MQNINEKKITFTIFQCSLYAWHHVTDFTDIDIPKHWVLAGTIYIFVFGFCFSYKWTSKNMLPNFPKVKEIERARVWTWLSNSKLHYPKCPPRPRQWLSLLSLFYMSIFYIANIILKKFLCCFYNYNTIIIFILFLIEMKFT